MKEEKRNTRVKKETKTLKNLEHKKTRANQFFIKSFLVFAFSLIISLLFLKLHLVLEEEVCRTAYHRLL